MTETEKAAAEAAPPPCCCYCQSLRLWRRGLRNGRPYYQCRACRRHSHGQQAHTPSAAARRRPLHHAPTPIRYPCPYCWGRCWKSGHDRHGRQMFVCTVCRKFNTDLYPEPPRSPGGPFPHLHSFYLSLSARRGLSAYCAATGMSPAQAVRDILRRAASPPLFSAVTRGSRRVESRVAPVDDTLPVTMRLPDARRRPRVRKDDGTYQSTVYLCDRISVCLDDAAKAGLLKTMRAHNLPHQDAARLLLTNARPPR